MDNCRHYFKNAFWFVIILVLLTGIIYPVIITLISTCLFKEAANGSLIYKKNQIIGSKLIGQNFTQNAYFWGRPSASLPNAYNALNSTGSNLSLSNPLLTKRIQSQQALFFKSDPQNRHVIPSDLLNASASGLDPDISPEAAYYQVNRVAKGRKMNPNLLNELISVSIQSRFLGFMGEPRVNVLLLNIQLDRLSDER